MKHCHVTQTRTIMAPPDQVWAIINQITGMEDWYPGLIKSSHVDQDGDDIRRTCLMTNGGQLDERILLRDAKTRTFTYAIDRHPLPAMNVVGTFRVDDLKDRAGVSWSAQFTAKDEDADSMTQTVNQMYAAGLESLATFAAQ